MSPRIVLGGENVPRVAEVVNRSLKADCTDFISSGFGFLSHNFCLRTNLCTFCSPTLYRSLSSTHT